MRDVPRERLLIVPKVFPFNTGRNQNLKAVMQVYPDLKLNI
jgi:hypothetical protein